IFLEKKIYITNKFFIKNQEASKLSCNSFSNILSIDELNMAFSILEKYKTNFEVIKKQKNKNFRHFLKSDNNRLIFLWKIKKNYKKLNFFIFFYYSFKIIYKKK